ncbi:YaiO family outer membrane beta-barrel protein [Ekhidna sp.]|uniref:YaiO family outer membrane beta-barrel protein n=1 Tax=Ekhidna sp. TaxID=2608089 RepID=UPI003C7AF4F1
MNHLYITCMMLLLASAAHAQRWKNQSIDQIFEQARIEAREKEYAKSREKLQYILHFAPHYHDVSVQMGRTYAWEGRYMDALLIYNRVLKQDPGFTGALHAKIDVEIWSNKLNEAHETTRQALEFHPDDEGFLLKRAKIHQFEGNLDRAIETLNEVLKVNPANLEALDLKIALEVESHQYTSVVRSGVDMFDQSFDPALFGSVEVNKKNNWGALIARVNYAHRFEEFGLQGELDVYPVITEKVYGYINYGYSQSVLFSNHRIGAEIYAVAFDKLEASLGARYLQFSTQSILTYTASMRYYLRSFEFSMRPFYTREKSFAASSIDFGVKKNFKQPETYFEFSAGVGYSPDIRINQTFAGQTESFYTLESKRATIKVQKSLGDRWSAALESRVNYRELSAESDEYLLITSLISTIKFKF